jgi:hypothetical protein
VSFIDTEERASAATNRRTVGIAGGAYHLLEGLG